jgi:hypothetical protein
MNRRRAIIIGLVLAVFGTLLISLLLSGNEPRYKGHSLKYWLTQMREPKDSSARSAAAAAVRGIGTNAVPYLIRYVMYETTEPKLIIARKFSDWQLPNWLVPDGWEAPGQIQQLGVLGFMCLGEKGAAAIPALARHLTNGENHVSAASALRGIGEKAIPVLITSLRSPYQQSRFGAISALEQIGPAAYPAIPELLSLAEREPALGRSITDALLNIENHEVESTDYRMYISNLRRIGRPEQVIREIVLSDVNMVFGLKRAEHPIGTNRVEFWRTGTNTYEMVKQMMLRNCEQLELERKHLLRELLGNSTTIEDRACSFMEADIKVQMLDFLLIQEKRKALRVIEELNQEFEAKFRPLLDSQLNADARIEYANFYQVKEQRLSAALGDAGKENYELRMSSLADLLRTRFLGVEFSEAQFREVYCFAKPLELNLDDWFLDNSDVVSVAAYKKANQAIWDKAQEVIGDQHFQAKPSAAMESKFRVW